MSNQKSLFVAAAVAEDRARQVVSYPAPAPDHVWFSQAFRDVGAERRRQIETEGWSWAHDDEHGNGELARAGAAYALEHASLTYTETPSARLQQAAQIAWPWSLNWWKPGNARRMLVKAAALIIAEIERIDRKQTGD